MPNVDDHGLEVLKKAAINIGATPKTDYALQTMQVDNSGTVISETNPAPVSIFATIETGLFTEILVNSSTWTLAPTSPMIRRNHIWLQNQSDVQIKINFNNTEPDYKGLIIEPGHAFNMDLKSQTVIYIKSQSGSNNKVGVAELL